MVWIDIAIGAILGLFVCVLIWRLYEKYPKSVILLIILIILIGMKLSDEYLTKRDKPWNILYKLEVWLHLKK